MKKQILAMLACAPMLIGAQAPEDAAIKQQRHEMGARICGAVLDGALPSFPPAIYRAAIDEADWDRDGYCHCAAAQFADDPDDRFGLMSATGDDATKAMHAKIEDALQGCLPGSGDMADLADDALPPVDESDLNMCRMALDGGLMLPGFDEGDVAARMAGSGQTRDDLCGCSAQDMAIDREAFDAELEAAANPTLIYGSRLAGTINQCLR